MKISKVIPVILWEISFLKSKRFSTTIPLRSFEETVTFIRIIHRAIPVRFVRRISGVAASAIIEQVFLDATSLTA